MIELFAKAFETPELASTNMLSILTLWLSITTVAEGHLWLRTRQAAVRATLKVLAAATRRGFQKVEDEVEDIHPAKPAAQRLHRNASIHRY